MASEADDSGTSFTYELDCIDCSYESTVTGSVYDALDIAEAHQQNREDDSDEHFVNIEAAEETGT